MVRIKRFLPLIALAAVIALIFGMGWNRYLSLDTLREHGAGPDDVLVASSLDNALELLGARTASAAIENVFVIGGAAVYAEALASSRLRNALNWRSAGGQLEQPSLVYSSTSAAVVRPLVASQTAPADETEAQQKAAARTSKRAGLATGFMDDRLG